MADQPIDKATVVNRALIKIGQAPVFSLDEESFASGNVDAVWPGVVAHCFSLHDWSFCRRTSRLTRLATAFDNGWAYGFQLPGDRIGEPLKVLQAAGASEVPLRDYALEEDSLFANTPNVWARCKVAVDPAVWDVGFTAAFEVALGAALAIPMQSDADLAATLFQQAFGTPSQGGTGGLFGRLIAQNRAGSPMASPFTRSDPLSDARWQ